MSGPERRRRNRAMCFNPQTVALIAWLRVIHERDLPMPSCRVLARHVGYKNHKTVHERARMLVKRGVIPADYWPKHHKPASEFYARWAGKMRGAA